MYIPSPNPSHDGATNITEGIHSNVAPSGVGHDLAGYKTEEEAVANALPQNTTLPAIVARGERWLLQSGVTGHKEYRNTEYVCSHMRRTVVQRSYHLARHKTSGRYYCESVPIRLGATDALYQGWLDESWETVAPSSGSLAWDAVINRATMENCRRRGVVECKQKMLESKMDLAETLVDLDDTVLGIAEATWRVLKAFLFARKGNWPAAFELLGITKKSWNPKTISDGWLALQYAWLPLLSDIFSGVEAVKDMFNDPLAHHTYAKRRTRDGLWARKLTGDSNEWISQSSSGDAYVEVETKFRFRVSDALLAYIAGFQLSNPLYVFWVAMPLTFVVDWFLPIGDWLGSLTATHGLEFKDGYQTTKTMSSIVVRGHKRVTWRHIWDEVRPVQLAESRAEIMFMERRVFTGWPMSYTYFKFPFSSPQRIASAIALTRGLAG